MIEFISNNRITFLILVIWLIIYIFSLKYDLKQIMCGEGINKLLISREYYRLFTGQLLHTNLIHLLANGCVMFWLGTFLEIKIGHGYFLLFFILVNLISEVIFACIYANAKSNIGASAGIFSIIGLIFVLQLRNPDQLQFELDTWYGNWIVLYSILANIPILKFVNLSTVVAHIIGLMIGITLTLVFILFHIF